MVKESFITWAYENVPAGYLRVVDYICNSTKEAFVEEIKVALLSFYISAEASRNNGFFSFTYNGMEDIQYSVDLDFTEQEICVFKGELSMNGYTNHNLPYHITVSLDSDPFASLILGHGSGVYIRM